MRLLLFLLLIVALTDFLLVLFLLYSNSIRFEHFSYLRFACAFVVSFSISYNILKYISGYICIFVLHILYDALFVVVVVIFLLYLLSMSFVFV